MKTVLIVSGLLMASVSTGYAYEAQPEAMTDQGKSPRVVVATACTQQLSPRMAAAFGLPLAPTGCKQG